MILQAKGNKRLVAFCTVHEPTFTLCPSCRPGYVQITFKSHDPQCPILIQVDGKDDFRAALGESVVGKLWSPDPVGPVPYGVPDVEAPGDQGGNVTHIRLTSCETS